MCCLLLKYISATQNFKNRHKICCNIFFEIISSQSKLEVDNGLEYVHSATGGRQAHISEADGDIFVS